VVMEETVDVRSVAWIFDVNRFIVLTQKGRRKISRRS